MKSSTLEQDPGRIEIAEIVRRLATRFQPHKIILFGSHARGTASADSDADLLVVMPVQGSRRKLATEMELALAGVNIPADLIVVTPEQLRRDENRRGTVVHPAVREGIVLYERVG